MLNGGQIYYPYFPELAGKIGIVESFILQLIHFYSSGDNSPLRDDAKWAYLSYQTMASKLGVSKSTIRRGVASLKSSNLLIVGRYNKHRYDKTNWYRVNYEVLDKLLEEDMKTFSKVSAHSEHMDVLKMSTPGVQNEHMDVLKMSTPCAQNGTTIQYKKEYKKEVEERKEVETSSPHTPATGSTKLSEVREQYKPKNLIDKIQGLEITKQNTKDKFFTVFNLLLQEKYETSIKLSPTAKERGLVGNTIKTLTANSISVTQFLSYTFENWDRIRNTLVWDDSQKPRLPEKPSLVEICYVHKDIVGIMLQTEQTTSPVKKEDLFVEYQKRKNRRLPSDNPKKRGYEYDCED